MPIRLWNEFYKMFLQPEAASIHPQHLFKTCNSPGEYHAYLFKQSAFPLSIILAVEGSSFSSTIRMHIPRLSIPRRPARPLICIYSPLEIHLNLSPSNLRTFVNTTVLAGIFKPMLKVSVANKHCRGMNLFVIFQIWITSHIKNSKSKCICPWMVQMKLMSPKGGKIEKNK